MTKSDKKISLDLSDTKKNSHDYRNILYVEFQRQTRFTFLIIRTPTKLHFNVTS